MEPNDTELPLSNVTVTCEFYRDCNNQPGCKLTFTPAGASPGTSYLNIVPDPEQQRVLSNAKAILASVPAVLGSKIMQLVPTSNSPFVQAMQWILGSQEGQCSTTYHGCNDAPGIFTLGVGLRMDISSHACPIRRLNEVYPGLGLDYALLSTRLEEPKPPLTCNQVNSLLYSTLAQSCPDGNSAERAFTPYMQELQERLIQSSCGLGDTLLSANQIAMLLTMYLNSPTFVGNKLCATISHGDNKATIRQVVLYSDGKSWSVGTQNRQTFSANLLDQVQLPWYQFKKIALHSQTSVVEPVYGEPTSGLPYGDDQSSFLGDSTVDIIHSDEPDRTGKYITNANDLIVYGTPADDYFNFTSGGSVVAFGGNGRDILAYEMPATADNPQYAAIYLGGNDNFDYYPLNALNPNGGEIQINDPDGGTIMLPGGAIAGIPPITISKGQTFSADVTLTVADKKATLDIKISQPNKSQFKVTLFEFTSGDYGIFRRDDCITRFSASSFDYIRPVNAERFFVSASSYNPIDVTVQNLQGAIVNQIQVRNSWGGKPSATLSTQLYTGGISYIFSESVDLGGPPCYLRNYYHIYGRVYNSNGVQTATLTPSSSYPAAQFCPTPANPNINSCNIVEIQFTSGLNTGHQAIVYTAQAQSNQDCLTFSQAQYLKVYDASGQALSPILQLPRIDKSSILGIYGTSLDKLTMLLRDYPEESYGIYRANLYANSFQRIDVIDNATSGGCVSAYQNGFILTFRQTKTSVSMRAMYNDNRLLIQPTGSYSACYGYNIELTQNLAMLVDFNNVQLMTSANQNVGPYSGSACSGSIFAGSNAGIFFVNENTVRLISTSSGLHTRDIEISGLRTKFNVPDDFPALPQTVTHHDFPPAPSLLAESTQFDTGRSLQSTDSFDDESMTSSANRLAPNSLISALWFAQRYLSSYIPNFATRWQDSVLRMDNVAEPAIGHALVDVNALVPAKPISHTALMPRPTFTMPGKQLDLTRTVTQDVATGAPIFTFHALDGEVEVGRVSLYAHPLVCRSEDGLRHNMVENTGIFANVEINPSELTEVCAELPVETSVINYSSMAWSAAHGALRGSANVVGQAMRQQGISDTVSRYSASAIHFVGYWLLSFIQHYQAYSSESALMVDESSAMLKAAMSACVDVLHLLLMTTVCAGVAQAAHYASQQASRAGYTKTAMLASFIGKHVDKTVYANNVRHQGMFNTVLQIASGTAMQLGVERIGGAMLPRRF